MTGSASWRRDNRKPSTPETLTLPNKLIIAVEVTFTMDTLVESSFRRTWDIISLVFFIRAYPCCKRSIAVLRVASAHEISPHMVLALSIASMSMYRKKHSFSWVTWVTAITSTSTSSVSGSRSGNVAMLSHTSSQKSASGEYPTTMSTLLSGLCLLSQIRLPTWMMGGMDEPPRTADNNGWDAIDIKVGGRHQLGGFIRLHWQRGCCLRNIGWFSWQMVAHNLSKFPPIRIEMRKAIWWFGSDYYSGKGLLYESGLMKQSSLEKEFHLPLQPKCHERRGLGECGKKNLENGS